MPRTPEAMREAIVRNLPKKTGRTIDEWIELLRAAPASGKERVEWLKHEHGLDHVQAATIVDFAERPAEPTAAPVTAPAASEEEDELVAWVKRASERVRAG